MPENLQALLDAAVKANPHDSFARRYQQRNDLEARTNPARDMARQAYRLHAARQPEEALKAAYSAVGRLDRLIADFPDAQEPRWLKARLLQLIGQIEPANQDKLLRQALELAEAICRAFPLAADPLLLKAGVLAKLGRLDGAKVTLKQAENLRQVGPDNRPEEYRRVRAILTKLAARQATTTQDRGGK